MVAAWNRPGLTLFPMVKRRTGFTTNLEHLLEEAERVCSGFKVPRLTVHQPSSEKTAVLEKLVRSTLGALVREEEAGTTASSTTHFTTEFNTSPWGAWNTSKGYD